MVEPIQIVEKIPKPREVVSAVRILWICFILGVAASLFTFVTTWPDLINESMKQMDASASVEVKQFARAFAAIVAVFSVLVGLGLSILLYIMISKGYNWARIVVLVFFVIGIPFTLFRVLMVAGVSGLPSFPGAAIHIPLLATVASMILVVGQLYALVLLFSKPASAWFKAPRERRGI
jgi:hypothetical protein